MHQGRQSRTTPVLVHRDCEVFLGFRLACRGLVLEGSADVGQLVEGVRGFLRARLMRRLLSAPAGLFSVNRLHNDFRSQGVQVGKDSLHAFVDHLHDAFLFFPLSVHTDSERVRQSNPRKVYPVDPGLVTAAAPQGGWGTGQLLETLAFLHLRRQGHELSYYRRADGTEVDFVVQRPEGPEAIQVSADMTSVDTRKRELRALEAAMEDLGLERATVVTLSADERVSLPTGTVRIVPFWMWARDLVPSSEERDVR